MAAGLACATVVVLASCGAERAAPVPTRPEPPSTRPSTTVAARRRPDNSERTENALRTSSDKSTTTSTTELTTTTTVPPSTTAETTTTTTVPPLDPAWAAFDQILSERLIGGGDYAVSVAVAVDGQLVHEGAYGYRVPPPPPPPAPPSTVPLDSTVATTVLDTTTTIPAIPPEAVELGDRFRIASISKVITATVVLQLVEAGQLTLDEPVGDRLVALVGATPVDPAVSAITVRQLLSHTAGFPSYQNAFFGGRFDSCPSIAQYGLSSGLNGAPGTVYTYSNLNFCLLGLLVEDVAGRPYEAVVQDRLLGPLGITGMRLAGTFDSTESEVIHPSGSGRHYMEVLGAAGSWVATAADIVTILDSLDRTKPGWHPLSSATVELMHQPAAAPVIYRDPNQWYGLGLIMYADGAWGHTGTIENTHAMGLRRPDGVTWSVLVNGEVPWESENLRQIFDEAIASSGVIL